ncbi:MAG TPA: tRNA 2-thiouridine(34) synthase MnmA [Clostridia bacterium]|nr:tRNA 2-thiouridine(34) synthase MnmA [Clostridia bacterium]
MASDRYKGSVLIGLSGGVDSAVSAYLLKEKGYKVYGITYILSDNQLKSAEDAKAIAKTLDIPLYIEDKKKEFNDTVVSYFVDSYICGETPNPCVLCNSSFKLKNLTDKADSLSIDYVATGHYANIQYDKVSDRYILRTSENKEKDQSYFLYRLSRQQLARLLLPISDMNKEQVRDIAAKIRLTVKDKKDSQDICFIKDIDYTDLIKEKRPGKYKECTFIDKEGNVLGKGANHIHFTTGQRRGLNKGFNQRMYVISKNAKSNTVTLGPVEDLYTKVLTVKDIHLIQPDKAEDPLRVKVKIRNTMAAVDAVIEKTDYGIKVVFDQPVRAAAKGQSAVFYLYDQVIGGGIIDDCI